MYLFEPTVQVALSQTVYVAVKVQLELQLESAVSTFLVRLPSESNVLVSTMPSGSVVVRTSSKLLYV